jgi:transcriptional regulator GlxA family with amidase domain
VKKQPVLFILPPRTLLLDVAGPAEALRMANQYQNNVRFDLRFAGATSSVDSSIGLLLNEISPLPVSLPEDVMIVVSGASDAPDKGEIKKSRDSIVNWLRAINSPNRRFVFICSGALLAARAGLLDHRFCTTHHSDCDQLRRLAPAAKVLENRIYVTDGNVCTSAGVTAGIDLMLYLIAEIAGPLCAVLTARNMVVYLRRAGGDPQLSPWLESRNHMHPTVHRVQDAMSADPAYAWTLKKLGDIAHASPRHIARLFQQHTRTTPVTYLNRLRLALARQLLANSQLPLERIAERAGFRSSRHMRRIWQQYNLMPPGQWRRKTTLFAR